MNKVNKKAWEGLIFFLAALLLLLFLPAWTINYWQAWAFWAVFSILVIAITVYLMQKDPELLKRRLSAGPAAERQASQKLIQFVAQFAFVAVIILPPLDHRFGWSVVPLYLSIAGNILVALGLYIVFLVFKQNTYTSAIVEVAPEQKVISTGPYALVRHPMYSGAIIMLLGIPLALGSWWGIVAVIMLSAAIIWRLLDEEKYLSKNLPGYPAYQSKVLSRLVPFIW
ncbi:MAG: isoprenylcysteine carboxylmethyltransferase family protein [Candidatus Doudnabacteria bacterium]|nr:isoprenylcysteine carboxylmethyltransferase family protein [Candidatus Doudnabacteria bacterium]